jgi:alpha-galactosidase
MRQMIGVVAALAMAVTAQAQQDAQPWQVFVLAGQSNMEGKGAIEHLNQLLADPATADTYAHLLDGDTWTQRDDVLIRYTNGGSIDRRGPLTVGYGNPSDRFGPELGFGTVVGDALDSKVLLIKVCWGGRSLRVDFRPPSAEPVDIDTDRLAEMAERRGIEGDPSQVVGHSYRELVRLVRGTLDRLDQLFPTYDGAGYEVAGFVWFQGWNDVIDGEHHAEYGPNLAALLRDLRADLGVPDLPMVIGELGQSGLEEQIPERYRAKHMSFRTQQESVALMPEFEDTVRYVPTSPYLVLDGPEFDGGYHYRGRADVFYHIGSALGEAMLDLAPLPTPGES